MSKFIVLSAVIASIGLLGCQPAQKLETAEAYKSECPVELVVLGIGQDAGAPQIGNPNDPAWKDPSKRLYATSLGLLDHENNKRYLIEATPDIREQMQIMDRLLPYDGEGPYIDGIFLTHAHIGHYAGLMFLGRESMGTQGVPVYVLSRMKKFLETNGPWSQLVELGNIDLRQKLDMNPDHLTIVPGIVTHRDEYSETALFEIRTPRRTAVFLPDIDNWNETLFPTEKYYTKHHVYVPGVALFQAIGLDGRDTDYAFLDATFYDDNELPGRDMSEIPHPRVTETMDLIDGTDDPSVKDKVRFIHINHTNPLRDPGSKASQEIKQRGYKLAYRGERFCL